MTITNAFCELARITRQDFEALVEATDEELIKLFGEVPTFDVEEAFLPDEGEEYFTVLDLMGATDHVEDGLDYSDQGYTTYNHGEEWD